jgi:hypothetical protein
MLPSSTPWFSIFMGAAYGLPLVASGTLLYLSAKEEHRRVS